jgi:TonB family protein
MLAGCAVGPTPSAAGPTAARFHAPEELLMLPEGSETPQPTVLGRVRYPSSERASGEGATVVVGFVIDTSGAVEYGTISFLQTARSSFLRSVCDALRTTRFAPAVSQGRPRRSLVVMPFQFAPLRDVLRGLPPFDLPSYWRALANQPRDSVISQLERAPHCQ